MLPGSLCKMLFPRKCLPIFCYGAVCIWESSFWASLPEGGVDGGLVIYADHPVLRNNLRAKTGSFTGVRTLSGFLKTRNGQELAFTVLINHYTCTPKELQEAGSEFFGGYEQRFGVIRFNIYFCLSWFLLCDDVLCL